jgi:hypothetical protein
LAHLLLTPLLFKVSKLQQKEKHKFMVSPS